MATPPRTPSSHIGDYKLGKRVGNSDHTETYAAVQLSVRRDVELVLLNPDRCRDADAVTEFRRQIRAKAAATHPHIAAIYEASEADGTIYYAREVMHGRNLEQLAEAGKAVPLTTAWKLVQATADAFSYLERNKIAYDPLTPADLALVGDEPFLTNLAINGPTPEKAFENSSRVLAERIPLLLNDAEAHIPGVMEFFARMEPGHENSFRTWSEVAAAALEGQRRAASGFQRIDPDLRNRTQASLKKKRKASGTHSTKALGIAAAVTVVLGLGYYLVFGRGSRARELEERVHVPAGQFLYQNGELHELPEFRIDQYEVTVAQYKEFLDALERAGEPTAYDHPDQPAGKAGHTPDEWDVLYPQAKAGGKFRGVEIDLNCPVFLVDWWDAFAYARWKERRLPTEEEWEKAARGKEGNLFPWGMEPDAARMNSGSDYSEATGQGGETDGFNAWCPVDAFPADRSPWGTVGMGGNVSEWTASWTHHPEFPDRKIPVVRGASFLTKRNPQLTTRRSREPGKGYLSVGFRTVSDAGALPVR